MAEDDDEEALEHLQWAMDQAAENTIKTLKLQPAEEAWVRSKLDFMAAMLRKIESDFDAHVASGVPMRQMTISAVFVVATAYASAMTEILGKGDD